MRAQIIILALLLLIILFFVDMLCSTSVIYTGKVIDKHYSPSVTSYGTSTDSKGNVSTTRHTSSEEWLLIVERNNSEIVKVQSKSSIYYRKKIGEAVEFKTYYGLLTKWTYSSKAIN